MTAGDYWANRTVAVTGGLGFIGSHFVEELLARGARVICFHRAERPDVLRQLSAPVDGLHTVRVDLLDYQALVVACERAAPRIDAIVSCAAVDGNASFKQHHAAEILDANVRITSNVLRASRELDVGELVLISSAEIYGDDVRPLREEDDHRTGMRYTADGYVLSKTFAEILAELFRVQFGLRVLLPRPTNVYGPRDSFDPARNRVIPSMVAKVAAGADIEVWGDGTQRRSFIYVKDLVRAVLRMTETRAHGALNVATDETVSILELARLVSAALGEPERIRTDSTRPAGRSSSTLDITRMSGLVDFTPRSLREGLSETVEWYRRHQLAVTALAPR